MILARDDGFANEEDNGRQGLAETWITQIGEYVCQIAAGCIGRALDEQDDGSLRARLSECR